MAAEVYIGTSGWHYQHWRGLFYPAEIPSKEMFAFYSRHFGSVELNNTFYKLPAASTFDSWRVNSPANFVFAVKGSRFITHMKKLKDPESSTEKFLLRAGRLERKLGPILFQLPPNWHVNLERLDEFLSSLPKEHRYVFEFRDDSWLVTDLFRLLRHHNAAFCIHDLAGRPTRVEITADFAYVRFHGPGVAKYSGSYSPKALVDWAQKIDLWKQTLSAIYLYFNNDIGGHAVKNAKELKRLLQNS